MDSRRAFCPLEGGGGRGGEGGGGGGRHTGTSLTHALSFWSELPISQSFKITNTLTQ